jgi:hypothetical protein
MDPKVCFGRSLVSGGASSVEAGVEDCSRTSSASLSLRSLSIGGHCKAWRGRCN